MEASVGAVAGARQQSTLSPARHSSQLVCSRLLIRPDCGSELDLFWFRWTAAKGGRVSAPGHRSLSGLLLLLLLACPSCRGCGLFVAGSDLH